MSKGVHIVLPGSAIKSNAGIILKTPISVLFLIPWGDKWIVGTTDTPYIGDRAEPFASREDVQYILDQANRVLSPKLDVSQTHAESSQSVTFTVVQGPTPSPSAEPTKKPTKKPSVDGCSKQIKN